MGLNLHRKDSEGYEVPPYVVNSPFVYGEVEEDDRYLIVVTNICIIEYCVTQVSSERSDKNVPFFNIM